MFKTITIKLILLFLLSTVVSYSQSLSNKFVGVITYSLTYDGNIDQTISEQQPKEIDLKFDGNKIRTDIDEGGANIAIIKNGDTKNIITLMDISVLNKKVMIKTSREEIDNKLSQNTSATIKFVDGTKEIAGYTCKKGELITKDKEGKESVDEFYYTYELGRDDYNFDGPYRDVNGILMEYVTKEDNIKIIATATTITKKNISETEFLIPKGYEEMTIEQLSRLINN